ncbi:MAG: phosphomannomutase/phosphoglucomutase [Campylobacter sp.]|nr:phosphomannomutase/phosphoglucomutase [Campylobacter sp.]
MNENLKSAFREYDIRGIVGRDLNETSTKAIAYKLGLELKNRGVKTISIGHDARLSANELKNYVFSGLNKAGLEIYDIGLLPTPVGYFSVFSGEFDANIMITGSHNPKEYNGLKITIGKDSFFGKDIESLKDKVLEFLNSGEVIEDNLKAKDFDALTPYIEYFKREFSVLRDFKTPFVCDCANGAVGVSLSRVCKELNLNATLLFETPDGNFPNHHPDPSEEKNLIDLKKAMRENSINLGFGFDGDADRLAVLTPNRNIKGDELAYLFALEIPNPRVMGEVKCSKVMYDEIAKFGTVFMGKTGHSNIKKAMQELNIDLGAEVSGHLFFKHRYLGFDDALYAMMRVLELIQKGYDLDAKLDALPKVFSTDEIKINTTDETKFKIIDALKIELQKPNSLPTIKYINDIDGVRISFDDGWALVRASNTTPTLVTRFEGVSESFVVNLQSQITKMIEDIQKRL